MIDTNVKVQHQCEDIENGNVGGKITISSPSPPIATTCRPATVEQSATVKSRSRIRKAVRRVAIMSTLFAILAAFCSLVYYFLGWQSVIHLMLVVLIVYIIVEKKYRWFYVALRTVPRDLKALYRYIRLRLQVRSYQIKDMSIAEIFQQNVAAHPNKAALVFEDTEWTFAEVEEYSNKIANLFKSHGYKKGDIVALFLENRPEFVCIWLGLSKLGVIVPLINTNLRLTSLIHSITVGKSQAIIFGSELSSAITEILDNVESTVALYQLNTTNAKLNDNDSKYKDLKTLVTDALSSPPNITDNISYHDNLVYIYTSGTTGLPKAAVISHARFIFMVVALHWVALMKPNDKYYCPLPLYHTAGGCVSIGQCLIYGSTVVIKKKFSASTFFLDIKKYECTIAQYIGEMCRYVLAVPARPEDTQHKLRIAFGNGLRPQIWREFKERFNIKKIAEFYGATEGNANIMNVDDTEGAIGFVSRIIPHVYPISIIKVDPVTGDPIRNAKGLCMECDPNEPGVFIGKITPNDPSRAYLGYVDKTASKKKVVYDVFHKGDSAFISGDILIADELGYLFFKDRTGDTFRWKGENVSTSECEALISNIVSYKDVVVYGVEVTGQEGRAGMAAILDADGTLDLAALATGVQKTLPPYARPQFIRILKELEMTGTYKMKKTDLQKDSFDPNATSDNIYYLNKGEYSLVTNEIYEQINTGKIRL